MTTDAKVRIFAQNETAAAFREIQRSAGELGDKLHSIFEAAFADISIAGVWEGVKGAIEYGDAIAKAAEKSGMATAAFSQLAYAAKQNNVDIEALSKGIKSMQLAIDKGSSSFDAIGISITKLKQLNPDQQFATIAEAISRINDPAARAREAVAFFGKAGADLLPLLNQGAEGIRRLREEADALGLTLDEKGAKAMEDAETAIKKMDAAFQGLWQTLALKLAPVLKQVFDGLRIAAGGGTELEKLTKRLDDLLTMRQRALSANAATGLTLFMGTDAQWKALNDEIAAVNARLQELGRAASQVPPVNNIIGDPNAIAKAWEKLKDVTAEKKELLRLTLLQIDASMREVEADATASKRQLDYSTQALNADAKMRLARLKGTIEENQILIDSMKFSFNKLEEIAKSAAQGMQSDFEQFFYDPMKEGLGGLLSAFIDTVRRMIAQAAAAKLMQALFGDDAGSGFFGKVLGSIFGAVAGGAGGAGAGGGSFGYGGMAAEGGPVMGGAAYLVGERGPELFIPGASGNITPNGKLAGGGDRITINQVTHIDARGAQEGVASQLRRAFDANNEKVKRDILDGIRRRKYPI